jgi:hypothetical protein
MNEEIPSKPIPYKGLKHLIAALTSLAYMGDINTKSEFKKVGAICKWIQSYGERHQQ